MAPRVTFEAVRFLDDDQLNALLKSIARDKAVEGVRDVALIRVLMETGLRRGEVMGLRVTDLDLTGDYGLITVRAATSKMRRARVATVSKTTTQALKVYLRVRSAFIASKGRRDDDALWVSNRGTLAANGGLEALRRRLKAAGLPQVEGRAIEAMQALLDK